MDDESGSKFHHKIVFSEKEACKCRSSEMHMIGNFKVSEMESHPGLELPQA